MLHLGYQGGQTGVGVQQHLLGMVLARGVDDAIPHGDQGGTPLGFPGVVGDVVFAQCAVVLNIALRGRRGDDAVFHCIDAIYIYVGSICGTVCFHAKYKSQVQLCNSAGHPGGCRHAGTSAGVHSFTDMGEQL